MTFNDDCVKKSDEKKFQEFELIELGKVSKISMGQSPPSKYYNYEGDGIPFLQGVKTFGNKYPKYDTWVTRPLKIATKGEVLFSVRAPVGEVNIATTDVCIGRGLASISGYDNEFIYYLLKSFGQKVIDRQTGTVFGAVGREILESTKLPIPSQTEQKAIAKILFDLDAKIELNLKVNNSLESIAHAIFKHWFIDFEFPNEDRKPYKSSGGEMVDSELGKVPKKWTIKTLDGIANFLNGLALQRYPAITENDYLPVIKIKEMNYGISGSSDKASRDIPSEYIVHNGDVLFAWSGSLGVTIWCNGEGALNQHIFKISSNEYPKWFYYEWLLYYLPNFIEIARDKATTMGHIQRHHISESLVAVPDSNTLEIMNNVLKLIIDRIINLKVENDTLTKTRDLFLPSLISGKIRVPLEG